MAKFIAEKSFVRQFRSNWLPIIRERHGDVKFPIRQTEAVQICRDLEFEVPYGFVQEMRNHDAVDVPDDDQWHEQHLLSLFVALSSRRMWKPGFYNDLKTVWRRARETAGRSRHHEMMRATAAYDVRLLLWMLAEEPERESRECIAEVLAAKLKLVPEVAFDATLNESKATVRSEQPT